MTTLCKHFRQWITNDAFEIQYVPAATIISLNPRITTSITCCNIRAVYFAHTFGYSVPYDSQNKQPLFFINIIA